MSFGIGLGAFVDGLGTGMQVRDRIDQRMEQNRLKKGMKEIEADANAKFKDPLSDDAYDYIMRRQELLYRQSGDLDKALDFRKWSQEDAARKGTNLFASSLLKAQTGDPAGALDDAMKAAQTKGYMAHGYKVRGQDPIQDADGKTIGYRLHLTDPNGKDLQQDVAVGDIPRLVSTFANPQAAWESQQASAAAGKKRSDELSDYETKKKIDRQYDKPEKDTNAADYRKVAEDLSKSDLDWGDRSAEEQDKMIRDRLAAADTYAAQKGGTAPAPGASPAPQQVIVDQGTGEVVQPGTAPAPVPSPEQTAAAPGLGGGVAPTPTPSPSPQPAPQQAPAPQAAAPAPSQEDRDVMIGAAANMIRKGGDPVKIAQQLKQAGIGEQEWPMTVRSAIANRQGSMVGLGGP